jgi:hypothetical protein
MVLGWHVDSNLCKRFFLLNGKIDSLLDHVFAYHCDHMRQTTSMHSAQRTENDQSHFIYDVTSSFIPEQSKIWGIPREDIEEIHMSDGARAGFNGIMEDLLPGLSEATVADFFVPESYNHGVIYDTLHAFPFLANHLGTISPDANIGYYGGNIETLQLMNKFLDKLAHRGRLLVNRELIATGHSQERIVPDRCILVNDKHLCEDSAIFIFDAAMMHFPQIKNSAEISLPAPSKRADDFVKKLQASFLRCVDAEARRLQWGRKMPRKFILIGSQHTWFEGFSSLFIEMGFTPYSSHVRHGYIRSMGSPFSLTSRVRRLAMRFGFNNKEKIKRMPLLNNVARLVHRRLLISKK